MRQRPCATASSPSLRATSAAAREGERARVEAGRAVGEPTQPDRRSRGQRGEAAQHLRADQEAREVGRKAPLAAMLRRRSGLGASGEQQAGDRRIGQRPSRAEVEGARVGRAGRHQRAEDGVGLERGEELAGHEAAQVGDPTIAEAHPLAVGAGRDRHALETGGEGGQRLGLLAAHRLRAARGFEADAGDDPGRSEACLKWRQGAGEIGLAGRAGRVGRLAPGPGGCRSRPQSRKDGRRGRAVGDPVADDLGQGRLEGGVLDRQDAARGAALADHPAVRVEQEGAQVAVAPVDPDQPRRLSHSRSHGCSSPGWRLFSGSSGIA